MKKTITALNQEPVVSPKRNAAQRASWFIIILFFQPPPAARTQRHMGENITRSIDPSLKYFV